MWTDESVRADQPINVSFSMSDGVWNSMGAFA